MSDYTTSAASLANGGRSAACAELSPVELYRIGELGELPPELMGVDAAFAEACDRNNAKAKQSKTEERGKAKIHYDPQAQYRAAKDAEQLLLDAANRDESHLLFQRNGRYCAVLKSAGLSPGDPSQYELKELSKAQLRNRLSCVAEVWVKKATKDEDGKPETKSVKAPTMPDDLFESLDALENKDAPELRGVVTHPMLMADGSIWAKEGYDPDTRLFGCLSRRDFTSLQIGKTYPPLINRYQDGELVSQPFGVGAVLPGEMDLAAVLESAADKQEQRRVRAKAALAKLKAETGVFGEFRFETDLDADVAVAILLAIVQRQQLDILPGFLISASERASGKTTLMNTICAAALGFVPAKGTFPRQEDELRKVLCAEAQTDTPVLLWDNLENGYRIASPELDRLITSPEFSGRILGESRLFRSHWRPVVIMTGNNVTFAEDTASRFIECRLNPRVEHPERLEYKRLDPVAWAKAHRQEVLCAALDLLWCYKSAGSPQVFAEASRFKQFDMIRQAIGFAGGGDIDLKTRLAVEADPEKAQLAEFLELWATYFGDEWLTPGDVVERLRCDLSSQGASHLRNHIREMIGLRMDRPLTTQAVGRLLTRHTGRIADGRRLEKHVDSHRKGGNYRVAEALPAT